MKKILSFLVMFFMVFAIVGIFSNSANAVTQQNDDDEDCEELNINSSENDDDEDCDDNDDEDCDNIDIFHDEGDCDDDDDTATIVATKIVCDSETDLPNWGDNDPEFNITSNTATRFLNANQNCRLADWTFEWAPNGTENPGDN